MRHYQQLCVNNSGDNTHKLEIFMFTFNAELNLKNIKSFVDDDSTDFKDDIKVNSRVLHFIWIYHHSRV